MLPTSEDWNELSLEEVKELVARLQVCYQQGAQVYNQRAYVEKAEHYVCMVCEKRKTMTNESGMPNFVWRSDRQDPKTGMLRSEFICSQRCYFRGTNTGRVNAKLEVHTPGR